MDYLDAATLAELAKLTKRKGAINRLPPLVLLRVVQADGFRCRHCGTDVTAAPRAVLTLRERIDDPDPLGRYMTVCDDCRLALMKTKRDRDP